MPSNRRAFPRPLAGALLPLALAAGSLPLLAPTCAGVGEGDRTFGRYSIVIPMDRCYQFQTDAVTGTGQPAGCPQAADAGDVVKAYGLVYQLIRNDVAVHWLIDPDKTSVTAEDFRIQYGGGPPVLLYDWNTGGTAGAPTTGDTIVYKGGPFVVDGSDFARASAVLQQYKTTFSTVNVHVTNVAFRGYVKKTMAGGWSAGGAVPPKLALLDIGSGNISSTSPLTIRDPKNSEPVIEGYLARAGIGSGSAAGTAAGPHGEIYDKLGIDDFQPAAGSTDWRTSRFGQNGYQILWVPHWVAPGSCSNFSSTTSCQTTIYPASRIDQTLRTIGAFVAAGNDLFAECAGLGSFEGAFRRGVTGTAAGDYTIDYQDGDPSTRFQTPVGVRYNELPDVNSSQSGTQLPPPSIPGSFGSPLLQIGDFPFSPYTGAIEDYRPQNGTSYVSGVQRLITGLRSTASPELRTQYGDSFDAWDYFTFLPGTETRGTVVYLGGHSYSGVQGTFQIAGTRLVLNTLFNLGAGCTESGVACATGYLGVCSSGTLGCDTAGVPVCHATVLPGERSESCNGLDDDCDGLVDEGLEVACYDGPAGTRDVGLCRAGVRSCVRADDGSYAMSACVGEIRPGDEVCNALDDDCDGQVDESLTQACYFGPLDTVDPVTGLPRGSCRAGTQACTGGNWGACTGQVLPQAEACEEGGGTASDDNCDGLVNEGCGCVIGQSRACYGGPAGTVGQGPCQAGTQSCVDTDPGAAVSPGWTTCVGEIVPQPEICRDGIDQACNGPSDDNCAECRTGVDTEPCYGGPAGTQGVGTCRGGARACVSGEFAGACIGEVLPAAGEPCDGLDNDCDGAVDDGAVCADGFTCTNGLCVPSSCGTEIPCPEGFSCSVDRCVLDTCGSTTCAPGKACRYGACVDPCEGVVCGEGAVCASGACVGGSCYFAGCPTPGDICLDGACQPDPCGGVACPSGTFCRKGDCVQACTFVTCAAGERCGEDGFCVPDACAGRTCAAGERCVGGSCVADACAGKGCGEGQVCEGGVCVDDPCTGVVCPAGICNSGQCYPTFNPTGAGGVSGPDADDGSGCGCGSAGGTAVSALLGLLAVPLARRRRARRFGSSAAVLLAGAALLASGCAKEDEKPFDPSACANVCELETTRCVDFSRDPAHCGACGQSCPEASVCVDGVCGPAGAVAPRLTGVSPARAPTGGIAPVPVELSGERFADGATLRVVTPSSTRTYDTTFVGGRLQAEVEVGDVTPTTWHLRVVNPDRVISNALPFDVFVPSPTLASLTPASALAGATTDVLAAGTGLSATSQCHLAGAQFTEIALASSLGPTGLTCTVDATLVPPGPYEVWIVNDGGLSSSRLPFSVVSANPVVTAVSPSSGEAGSIVALTVLGTGFDLTSKVLFGGTELATTFIDATRLYVAQLTVPACGASCDFEIRVRNASGSPSAPALFRVGAQTVQITGVSPASAWQGDTVQVTFTGTGIPENVKVQAAPPAGSFRDASSTTSCSGGCTSVSGTLELEGQPEGSWLVRLAYPDGTSSSPYAFRVLSNQAILRDASPRGGAPAATPVAVTLTVGNLRPPYAEVRVRFSDGASYDTIVPSPVPSGSPPTTVQISLALAGRNTGTYTLAVMNPRGAAPSNTISFNVTPGVPTLATVSPSSAEQQEARVAVTLTGTNFARPDASGAGGSVVHISSAALGVTDWAVPTADTTVVSPTEIRVQLDTRAGVPGTYDVAVWNPGGPTPPQKSNVLTGAFTITP